MRVIAVDFIYSLKRDVDLIVRQNKMYDLSFDKINVTIACYEDIYGRYCTQKSKNDHFHPQFAIIITITKLSNLIGYQLP